MDIAQSTGQLWSTKQRQGHALHRICAYQGAFPPQLPAYFLDKYDGEVVLDPFCGRGTTILETVLRNRHAIGCDLTETALALARVKLACPARKSVIAEIEALKLNGPAPPRPKEFKDLYHPKTWSELWHLRVARKSAALTALALGRLHGHSPGFFSATTFNVVSLAPLALERMRHKHGGELPQRDVREILLSAANRFLAESEHTGVGAIVRADARKMPIATSSVDLVITSPPFLDVLDYTSANWVREWFIGNGVSTQAIGDETQYASFLRSTMQELRRVMRVDAVAVFEVGPIKRKIRLLDLVTDAARGLLDIEDVMTNDFEASPGTASVPKISRAMRKASQRGEETVTTANHCVILRKRLSWAKYRKTQ